MTARRSPRARSSRRPTATYLSPRRIRARCWSFAPARRQNGPDAGFRLEAQSSLRSRVLSSGPESAIPLRRQYGQGRALPLRSGDLKATADPETVVGEFARRPEPLLEGRRLLTRRQADVHLRRFAHKRHRYRYRHQRISSRQYSRRRADTLNRDGKTSASMPLASATAPV